MESCSPAVKISCFGAIFLLKSSRVCSLGGRLPCCRLPAPPAVLLMKGFKFMSFSILLVFDVPVDQCSPDGKLWQDFSEYVEKVARQDASINVLGINVLLIRIDTTLTSLQECLRRAGRLSYKYSILPEGLIFQKIQGEKATFL